MEVIVQRVLLSFTLENLFIIVLSLLDPLTVLRNTYTYTLDFIQILLPYTLETLFFYYGSYKEV